MAVRVGCDRGATLPAMADGVTELVERVLLMSG